MILTIRIWSFYLNNSIAQTPNDYRPIDLYNDIYKIVSKMINNLLIRILPDIIPKTQGTFSKNRNYTTITLMGLELIHQITNDAKTKSHWCNIDIKLDLSKAFDRVEWTYLLALLHKLQFPPALIQLISQCISTIKIAIHFNKSKTSYFSPTRGLKQGDPSLSSSVFMASLCS